MQGAVDVTRPGAHPLGLGPHHDGPEAAIVETEHLIRRLDDDAELVVVLPTRDAGAVRSRAHFDEQDRRLRQRRKPHRRCAVVRAGSVVGDHVLPPREASRSTAR